MIKEAIEKILDIANPPTIETFDRRYSTINLHPMKEPTPEPLQIHTLKGIINWIDSGDYDHEKDPCIILIDGYRSVSVISRLMDPWKQRKKFIGSCPAEVKSFPFGSYLDIESFLIEMQTKFVDTKNKKKVIDYVSKIRGELVTMASDDGIAQEVAIEDKIGRLAQVKIDPIVTLAPFRTFPELSQPESPFLLRMRSGRGELPTVALFEADGGKWKIDAIKGIAEYFIYNDTISKLGIDVLS